MNKVVFCKFAIDGIHCWADIPDNNTSTYDVQYLKNIHRHMFNFVCYKDVSHSNRDVEFINLKHDITDYLRNKYYDECNRTHCFESKSCEMLAEELIDFFKLCQCEVNEDNENGCIVKKDKK